MLIGSDNYRHAVDRGRTAVYPRLSRKKTAPTRDYGRFGVNSPPLVSRKEIPKIQTNDIKELR
jgi:hypothetical protein